MPNQSRVSSLNVSPINIKMILIGSLGSFSLLIIFLILQYQGSTLLNLDQKWLILSTIPILISIILSGITKSVKGLGIELEFNLSEPLPTDLIGPIEYLKLPAIGKASIEYLENLSMDRKKNIERLQFILGLSEYGHNEVNSYLHALPKLKFIEIVNANGEFLGLKSAPKINERIHNNDIGLDVNTLIMEIQDGSIIQKRDVITDFILKSDSMLEAYKKMNSTNQGKVGFGNSQYLPILDSDNKMVGVIYRYKLAEKIAQATVNSYKN